MSAVRPPVQSTLRPREGGDLHRPTGVNLRRSKTSVGTLSQPYPTASVQAVTRSYSTAPQFRPFVARYRPADIPLHGGPPATNSQYRKISRGGPSRLEMGDQFCEFQAAPSFDLPNMDILKRATTTASSGKSDVSRDRWENDRKSSSVVFEGEEPLPPHCLFGENIRYQGMDALGSPVDRNNNSVKQKSLMKNYYSSWEDLLEKSEIAERSNLARRRHYGSTESINSSGSEGSRPNPAAYAYQKQHERELMQAAGHHLQLHAVHNQTYQTSSSALETCPELDESDVYVQMYDDLPRRGNAPAAGVKKSNSRVCSSGKLCLRVESFSEKRNNSSSATQTETVQRRTSAADSGKYVGLYQKSSSR
jgi:hypothetical protein